MDIINPPQDPISLFNDWFQQAGEKEINDPNVMALATADKEGRPSVRMVLLKGITDGNFVFFTNLDSRKGNDLKVNCHVALCFHWKSLRLQIRVEGVVEPVSDEEANTYFATRPVGSQIGAWASKQSRPLDDRSQLEEALAAYSLKFGDDNVPRPSHWSGFRVIPQEIEFWEEQPFRLHNRLVYTRNGSAWKTKMLYP
ncbi:pyridoxamine 5'-phosphate oxidase [Candidatus Odyssella acanthamoebae]|uniref:Pyridoxine/pyridoxamine 5'-phosphate oxidase n=1 Tax=Candidatus Odyssella acanthamoebae TaxID=91604 RepID=A0A077AY20_9PROT|nr:pyridoxamine 5'-phosphate oxidase [Candidatus Paracaedibacter acanthamoebae]AIK96909.1 pyridoxamine 5'-phosphate oxidase [Candidatus Paracaedibacter acanthamoebae]